MNPAYLDSPWFDLLSWVVLFPFGWFLPDAAADLITRRKR